MDSSFWHHDTNKKPRQSSDEVMIRRIHRNLMILLVVAVLVVAAVMAGLYRNNILGPIRGGTFTGYTLKWSISDHNDTNGGALQNQLSGTTDNPRYDDEPVTVLNRNNDGSLRALPRFQGQLEYHIP